MKYEVKFTNQFKRDLKLAKKQNRDLDKLFEAVNILADGGTLDAKYRDHDLSGNYKKTRECHIEPDWLLVYEIRNTDKKRKYEQRDIFVIPPLFRFLAVFYLPYALFVKIFIKVNFSFAVISSLFESIKIMMIKVAIHMA